MSGAGPELGRTRAEARVTTFANPGVFPRYGTLKRKRRFSFPRVISARGPHNEMFARRLIAAKTPAKRR